MIVGIIDIHNHIMPLVDDGSKSWEMSKKMLQMAYDEGIRRMIVTPHFFPRRYKYKVEDLYENLDKLKQIAYSIDSKFHLYLGNEIYYQEDIPSLLEERKIRTLASSKYVLVEFNPVKEFTYIKNSLQHVQMSGYSPILAHVERYDNMLGQIDYVEELIEMGVYIQVNASSIIGGDRAKKKFVNQLLKYELVHFIATDSHNLEMRPPKIQKCATFIRKKYGSDYARELVYENPMKVLKNEYIE